MNERHLAELYLARIASTYRQPLLDELAGKIRRQASTHNPVKNPIGLLCWMCNQTKAGNPPLTSDSVQRQQRRARERQLAHYEAVKRRERPP